MADDKDLHPIDIHVGKRVRMRRTVLKMSQGALGEKLGVTFQQVQKYEKAANRISASKLFQISQILKVPVSFFYEDAPVEVDGVHGMAEGRGATYVATMLSTPESFKLNAAFDRITKQALRKQMVELAKAIADETGRPEEEPTS